MAIAPPKEVPSERFVEQMGNHLLMNRIGPNYTYFHIPTQNKEKALGYDASLQGFKTLVLQYKRLVPNTAAYSGRIAIEPTQLSTLQAKFPADKNPYAFICFCLHKSYSTITPLFSSGKGDSLADKILFLDIHSQTLVSRPYPKSINTSLILPVLGTEAFKLEDLALKFTECQLGLFQPDEPARQTRVDESELGKMGNLSLLHAKLPVWTSNK